jgi:hypothetical protein
MLHAVQHECHSPHAPTEPHADVPGPAVHARAQSWAQRSVAVAGLPSMARLWWFLKRGIADAHCGLLGFSAL